MLKPSPSNAPTRYFVVTGKLRLAVGVHVDDNAGNVVGIGLRHQDWTFELQMNALNSVKLASTAISFELYSHNRSFGI